MQCNLHHVPKQKKYPKRKLKESKKTFKVQCQHTYTCRHWHNIVIICHGHSMPLPAQNTTNKIITVLFYFYCNCTSLRKKTNSLAGLHKTSHCDCDCTYILWRRKMGSLDKSFKIAKEKSRDKPLSLLMLVLMMMISEPTYSSKTGIDFMLLASKTYV